MAAQDIRIQDSESDGIHAYHDIIKALDALKIPQDVNAKQRFFKTGVGEYGEGDIFWGITVPSQRAIARRFRKTASLDDIRQMITHKVHEVRLTGIFLLVYRFEDNKKQEREQERCVALYLNLLDHVNNWDLVDSSAHKILGPWLRHRDRSILYELARSGHLWRERVAMISTMHFIDQGEFEDAFQIATILLNHPHDLIHKAVGWMLREIGKKDIQAEEAFLHLHYATMPRTMLRYALEKFPEEKRKAYLEGRI